MFGFVPQFHMTPGMGNPFGMGFTAANPRINFCLGIAAATSSMPAFSPYPMFGITMPGSVFAMQTPVPMTPSFGYNPFVGFGSFGMSQTPSFNFNNTLNGFNYNNTFSYLGNNISGAGSTFNTPFPSVSQFKFNYTPSDSSASSVSSASSSAANHSSKSSSEGVSIPAGGKTRLSSNAYGPAFLEKVKQVAQNINCDYKDLLAIMNSESGINASLAKGNYGGLIMFHKDTAAGLGTSLPELLKMSPIRQLDYVEKCFLEGRRMAKIPTSTKLTLGHLYALIFLPARANNEILCRAGESGNTFYKSNKPLDYNKDNKITRTELSERISKKRVNENVFYA